MINPNKPHELYIYYIYILYIHGIYAFDLCFQYHKQYNLAISNRDAGCFSSTSESSASENHRKMGKIHREIHEKLEVYPPVIQQGWLENEPFMDDFPIESPMKLLDFQVPRLITGGYLCSGEWKEL